jgi:hypothetical protein
LPNRPKAKPPWEWGGLFAAMFDTNIDEINLAARSRVEEMRELV